MGGTKIEADAKSIPLCGKKSTLRFEEKLKEKVQATLKYIHENTHEQTGEYEVESPEELPARLETAATVLDEKMETLTEQIAEESSG
ncbi:hypothetical protein [Paenibacillus senegalensis]|uniref:hypothetical protein n=1 Tax=Paenibacillus senegalensis TaxID=1465766 RepID=UPI000287E615|nr:hypothetical protein [Paenibacillus senegalensis]